MVATSYNFPEKHNQIAGIDGRFKLDAQTTLVFHLVGTTSRTFFRDPELDRATACAGLTALPSSRPAAVTRAKLLVVFMNTPITFVFVINPGRNRRASHPRSPQNRRDIPWEDQQTVNREAGSPPIGAMRSGADRHLRKQDNAVFYKIKSILCG